MLACWDFQRMRSRLQTLTGFRRRDKKRIYEIGQPFDFRKETTVLPGITSDEISVLREKAAASCLGIAHDHSPSRRASLRIPSIVTARTSAFLIEGHGSPVSSSSSGSLW